MSTGFGSLVRRRIVFFAISGFSSLLIFQLFTMQILHSSKFEEKSTENSVKEVHIDAPRGIFYDRDMNVLVSNKPVFTLQITPSLYNDSLNSAIEKIIKVDSGYINKILEKNRHFPSHLPRNIKKNVDFAFIAWYEENAEELSGVNYSVGTQRDYSFGVNGAHVFGYAKEISAREWKKNKEEYQMGDYIGYKGVEKTYEKYLRGEKGIDYFLVDSKQRIIGPYKSGENDIPYKKGNDLILTIDKETQIVAENEFKDKKGSVVAIEPNTGEILAFVSAPWYDLSQFSSVTPQEIWRKLRADPDRPLFNRATMSIGPPGSTSKMLPSIIGLEEGIINKHSTYYCAGGYKFGVRFFKCHGGVHGSVDVITAIEKSCNSFFYQIIFDIGLDRWHDYANKFGFGLKTGVDIDEEARGIVPSTDYYNRVYGKRGWTNGLLMNISIGQGEFSVTPIQLAQYVSLIANNGKTHTPHFVKAYVDSETDEVYEFNFDKINTGISQNTFDIVKKGMHEVVFGEGTARHLRMKHIEIAGKTGTSQNPHGEDHALFVAFAPYDNPKIAVAVMVENVGFGSTYAAPIAKNVIKAYLEKNEIVGRTVENRL